jgi:hypothetical protein
MTDEMSQGLTRRWQFERAKKKEDGVQPHPLSFEVVAASTSIANHGKVLWHGKGLAQDGPLPATPCR